ncbi:hypothetical protein IAT38_002619 [Cryptococcus sp. DSM 104549]
MSLFPSAFESSKKGPSPAISLAKPQGGKRKRPSTSGPSNDSKSLAAQVKQADANYAKILSQFGSGSGGEGKVEGRESMGLVGGKKGKKARKSKGGEEDEELEGTPKVKKAKGKETSIPTPVKGNQAKEGKQQEAESAFGKKKDKKQPPTKIEPVQLDMPTLPPTKKLKVGGEGNLTDMQKNMQAKLEGARFRWINEQLYSTPSTEAVAMMKKDPKIFADYHQTHRLLTSGWPSPPLPHIISLLTPLPSGTLIADLGCGDAGLARALVPQGKVVLSYDLVGDSGVPGSDPDAEGKQEAREAGGWVVEADFLEKVPLPGRPGGLAFTATPGEAGNTGGKKKKKGKNGAGGGGRNPASSEIIDVVVCCLSLMGKNWVGGIAEACRVLKQGGALHVAEVTSRFISTEAFVEKVESFGFELQEETAPSTHFTLFNFLKTAEVPQGPARGQPGWDARVEEGEEILRGCVYKKR